MAEQWSTETEELIGAALYGKAGDFAKAPGPTRDAFLAYAQRALAALADAGALLPTGGQQGSGDWRIVYGVGVEIVWSAKLTAKEADRKLVDARRMWPSARKQCRATTSWPDGSMYYGPWQEVGE